MSSARAQTPSRLADEIARIAARETHEWLTLMGDALSDDEKQQVYATEYARAAESLRA